MLDRVQELKDVAVVSISASHQQANSELVNGSKDGDEENKVSSSLSNKNSMHYSVDFLNGTVETVETARGVADIVKPHPELMRLCQQMDVAGLLHFILENEKTLNDIHAELSIALESAVEPDHLVLELLEGFSLPYETDQNDERDGALEGMYRSGIMMLKAFTIFLVRADASNILNTETKQEAKEIACKWMLRLNGTENAADGSNTLGAEALLQLLAPFRVASEFDEDVLCKFVLASAHHRQTPELCHSLGLTKKMPGSFSHN